jgi:hypothetical protein
MTALQSAGEALYGPRWQSDLARALGVSDRTMRRWVASDDVPDGVWAEIRALVKARRGTLTDVLRSLPASG